MRIFVNNVDGYIAGAICADLAVLSKNLVGTRKSLQDELLPPTVKRLVCLGGDSRRLPKAQAAQAWLGAWSPMGHPKQELYTLEHARPATVLST